MGFHLDNYIFLDDWLVHLILYIHISLLFGLSALLSLREPWVVMHLCIPFGLHLLLLTIFIFGRIVRVCLTNYYEPWSVLIWVAAYEFWWSDWYSMDLLDVIQVRRLVWIQSVPSLVWSFHPCLFSFSFLFFLFVHSCGYLGMFSFLFVHNCGYLRLWLYRW